MDMIADSNEAAFDSLFRKYYKPLYQFAGHYIRDAQIAENTVQDVFIKVWALRESINITSNVKAYLYTAVKNHLFNEIKKDKRLSSIDDYTEHLGSRDLTPENDHLKSETYIAVHKAIDELPEKCREIFKMHRYDNLKYNEIADILGISINTVKTQIKRALKSLKDKLEHLSIIILLLIRYL